jgi:hypothetical protein
MGADFMLAGILRWTRTVCSFLLLLLVAVLVLLLLLLLLFVLLGWAFSLNFSPLFQICCNYECNIFSAALYGMHYAVNFSLCCPINNLSNKIVFGNSLMFPPPIYGMHYAVNFSLCCPINNLYNKIVIGW